MSTLLFSLAMALSSPLPDLSALQHPPGVRVEVIARADNVRQLALAADGTLFAGSRRAGKVYAFRDLDRDGIYEQSRVIASNLNLPSGIALKGGDLYVAEVERILRFPGILSAIDTPPPAQVYFDQLPDKRHHGWKYLKFGPDGALYFNIGAPCNICLSPEPFATLVRLTGDKQLQIVARGVRNSVGFAWHPDSDHLWFTDNGRDHLGDDLPSDELNRLDRTGQHFGYPFRHGYQLADPQFGAQGGSDSTPARYELGAHVAPLGMTFYQGTALPGADRNSLFIAEHGSWNRSSKVGYRIVKLQIEAGEVVSHSPYISGWLQGQSHWGRPNDLLVTPQGDLLISDDYAGVIYRVRPEPAR